MRLAQFIAIEGNTRILTVQLKEQACVCVHPSCEIRNKCLVLCEFFCEICYKCLVLSEFWKSFFYCYYVMSLSLYKVL